MAIKVCNCQNLFCLSNQNELSRVVCIVNVSMNESAVMRWAAAAATATAIPTAPRGVQRT